MPKVVFTFPNPSGGGTITLHVTRDLAITEDSLQDCFETHAGYVSWYATLHRQAEFIAQTQEDEFDQWVVKKKNAGRDPTAKQTEKALDEAVQIHPEYVGMLRGVREARRTADTLKDFVTAWLERGRMLMKLGIQARERSETEYSEPSVHKKKRLAD